MLLPLCLKTQTAGFALTKNVRMEYCIFNKEFLQNAAAVVVFTVENAYTQTIKAHAIKASLSSSKKIYIFSNVQNAKILSRKQWDAII